VNELDQAVRAVVLGCLVRKPDLTVDGQPVVRDGALVL
jgi:hypothetical protein